MTRVKNRSRQIAAGALCAALAGLPAHAQTDDDPPPNARKAPPWSWDATYKVDWLHSRATGIQWIGNLSLRASADAGALLGWDGVTLHGEALVNHGGKPNRRIGSVQGISNLEVAESAARLYATWLEKDFGDGTSLLFGLYDLNSEFYATPASGLLIHPSFGIGIDFSQTGRNGPSIFPNLGLALRGKMQLGVDHYLQLAVIDGVPGDAEHPGRTVVRLSRDDGALLVAEGGWQAHGPDGPLPSRFGLGVWGYTRRSERIDSRGTERDRGVYALAQGVLRDTPDARTTGFVRAGPANRRINAVALGFDAGVLVERPFGDRGPGALTAGVALARFGRAQRDARVLEGASIALHETALEFGARWQPAPALAIQPVAQRIWNVGGRLGARATLVGMRLEWSFETFDLAPR